MKYLLAFLLAFSACWAGHNVRLAWDENTDPVTGYKLYIGTNSGVYYQSNVLVGITNTTSGFTNLPNGWYFFAATAWLDVGGGIVLESGYSSEASAQLGPQAPRNFKSTNNFAHFVFTNSGATIVEWSETMDVWRTDAPGNLVALTVTLDMTIPKQQFWRAR